MSVNPIQQVQPAAFKVQSQIQLPFSKAWQISIKSIKIRLARSIITAGGIFLGIAFYSSVRTSALFPAVNTTAMSAAQIREILAAEHRQQWLAIMALLVCFVGITNSMLMSVTERFREIGTMKCLGALNSFIVKLFFIEAGLMGTIASATGWLAGWLIIVLVRLITDGLKVFDGHFFLGSLGQMGISICIGTLITLAAAIPPAVRAAQMPPAVALRSSI